MKKSRNKEVVEKCLGMIFYVFAQQGQEIETSNKNFLVWKSLGEKKKMRRSSYQILFTSEDPGVEDQTLSEVERAINDVTSSTLSFNEMKDWLVVCQSFNKGDFFGINTEKSLSDKNFVKVATIHNILIPKTIVLHHHQIILNHFISL